MIRSAANSIHELTTRRGLTQPPGLLTGGAGFVVGVADLDPSGFVTTGDLLVRRRAHRLERLIQAPHARRFGAA